MCYASRMKAGAFHLITVLNISWCFWEFSERLLREHGRWSSCPLNLMIDYVRDIHLLRFPLPLQSWLLYLSHKHKWLTALGPAWVCCLGLASHLSGILALPGCCCANHLEFLAPPTTLRLGWNPTLKSMVSGFPNGCQRIWMTQCNGLDVNSHGMNFDRYK